MEREQTKDSIGGELASKQKKPQTAPSVNKVLSLPEDLITEILLRTPARSLLRFTCLSRHHSNLIQSPNFITAHAIHAHRNPAGLLLLTEPRSSFNVVASFLPPKLEGLGKISSSSRRGRKKITGLSPIPLSFIKNAYGLTTFQCVGSFNGLVCLTLDPQWLLWNPATSQFCFDLDLPEDKPKPRPRRPDYRVVGFGYDSVADDYKSVRVSWKNGSGAKVEILSWVERRWKEIPDESFETIFVNENRRRNVLFYEPPVATNDGRVYWMDSSSGMLLSFRVHDEEFEWMSMTPGASLPWSIQRTICVWRGSLAMMVQPRLEEDSLITLWLFNDGGEGGRELSSWSVLFTISTKDPPCMPEAIWKVNGRSSFLLYVNYIACNYSSGERLELPYRRIHRIHRAFEFAQTLVPIPGCCS